MLQHEIMAHFRLHHFTSKNQSISLVLQCFLCEMSAYKKWISLMFRSLYKVMLNMWYDKDIHQAWNDFYLRFWCLINYDSYYMSHNFHNTWTWAMFALIFHDFLISTVQRICVLSFHFVQKWWDWNKPIIQVWKLRL